MTERTAPRRGAGRVVVALVVSALLLTMSGIVGLTSASAADCTARPITADELTDFSVEATDGSDTLSAWESVRASLMLDLEDGHCAGDSITVSMPEQLGISNFPDGQLTDEDGNVIATTSIEGQEVTITLTDYVETHVDVSVEAWWQLQINADLEPGTTEDLIWTVDGETVTTPVEVGPCPNCDAQHTDPNKWGTPRPDGTIVITMETPLATRDDQIFEFTDTLTNGGQQILCDRGARAYAFSERNQWGDPSNATGTAVDVTDCSATSVTGSITLDEGQQARINVWVSVDDQNAGPWTDSVTFVSGGQTWTETARVTRRSYGGGGNGSTTPTTDEPTTDEPTSDEPTSDEPTSDEPTTDEPTTDEPTSDEPTTDEPTSDEPTTDEPTTDEPTSDEPTTDEPTTDEPTTDEPTTEGAPVPSSTSGSPVPEDGAAPAPGGPGAEAPTPSVVQTDGAGSGSRSLLPFAAAGMLLAAAGALALRPQAARRH
ncbi:hypothetical protein GCM10027055_03800 [Janibacter alkaliphilus]|uniref:SDR-like Ig domain-containing protein n=1 Tax=Janibacter alkaliphilus TaxID=1069963 RepID=A0A852XEQ7_9MICO|nr:Ig-like domain-containing protein [Janibacter alkaliphilus]NYG36995.1 hypothetical protein [Janibacter alkaliphilus]